MKRHLRHLMRESDEHEMRMQTDASICGKLAIDQINCFEEERLSRDASRDCLARHRKLADDLGNRLERTIKQAFTPRRQPHR